MSFISRQFLLHGSCVSACGERYYNYTDPVDSHMSCQLCDTSCLICDGPTANNCTSCVEKSAKVLDGKCVTPCQIGYVYVCLFMYIALGKK